MRTHLGVGLGLLVVLASGIANAEITQQDNWTQRFANAAGYPNGTVASFAIAPGSQRILLVAIASLSDSGQQSVTSISYGGMPMLLAQGDGDVNAAQHTYLYYLLEEGIKPLASVSRPLNVSISGGAPGANLVYSAVFAGVDQTAPFTDRKGWSSGATRSPNIGPFNPGLSMNPGDWPIEVILLHCLQGTGCSSPPTVGVWASGWDTPDSLIVNASAPGGAMPRFYLAGCGHYGVLELSNDHA